ATMWPMVATEFIKARLPLELKQRVKALSESQLLSESAWLKQLVVRELRSAERDRPSAQASPVPVADQDRNRANKRKERCANRIYVRLRREDHLLLQARASARGLRSATYVSVLTRCHLRRLTPLPKEEFLTLKRSINELAAIGRNLNQIARAANKSGRLPSSAREEFRAMLKVCLALRDHTKALLKANEASWRSGDVEDV
ncbi:MAG: plasmid mobilization relaxosome protein MobC, partial [Steroidobacteraceae bacterium]